MLTFCGVQVDRSTGVRATSGCDLCVAESIRDFARCDCTGARCASEHPKTGAGLDRRVPQTSEAARRLSSSGQILPPPRPCQDVELMERVHERLQDL